MKKITYHDVTGEIVEKDYTKQELIEIIQEICHNFGGIFNFIDVNCRTLEYKYEGDYEDGAFEVLGIMLKGPKFFKVFSETLPDEYSWNHVLEEAHWSNALGKMIEKTDFEFKKDRAM